MGASYHRYSITAIRERGRERKKENLLENDFSCVFPKAPWGGKKEERCSVSLSEPGAAQSSVRSLKSGAEVKGKDLFI